MRTDYLQQAYEASESPGLETFDPRLEQISAAMLEGTYEAAAEPVASVFDEQILDIRVIGYYCYLVFHEQGLAGLSEVFSGLSRILGEQWAAVGPLKNREKIAQNSFNWLYKQLVRRLQREESSQGPGWTAWIESLGAEDVARMLEEAEGARRALVAALEDFASPLLDLHGKVREWLQAFARVVYREPEAVEEPAAEAAGADEDAGDAEDEGYAADGQPDERPARSPQPQEAGDGGVVVEGSIYLRLLLRKIEAFARLLELEKFPRAALVADDINETLSNFDPLLYFPRVFADYARLLAVHIGDLAEFEDAKETRDWQALRAFYLADLESFVEE